MFNQSTAFPLPPFVHDHIDKAAADLLGMSGHSFDFSLPAGEQALVPANSVSWRIFKNQVTLFIGGVSAVLLEFAEPKVRDGVWQHSTFRKDALTRLQRTGLAAMVTVYGARSQAEAMIAAVVRRHGNVEGATSSGERYNANDQDLLDWVQATAGFASWRPITASHGRCQHSSRMRRLPRRSRQRNYTAQLVLPRREPNSMHCS